MLSTVLLASSNAGATIYIGAAPDKLNQAFVIPAVQFIWTDTCEDEGREYKIGTLKLTEELWEKWWGDRLEDLFPWAREFRMFASRVVQKREYWLACPLGCPARMNTLDEYEAHIREHLAQVVALHNEYLGDSEPPVEEKNGGNVTS